MATDLHAHRAAIAALVAGIALHAGFGPELGQVAAGRRRGDGVDFAGVEGCRGDVGVGPVGGRGPERRDRRRRHRGEGLLSDGICQFFRRSFIQLDA